MKALLLVAIVGIAATAMGVGFLGAPTFDVVAQDVGVGETDLTAPVSTAFVAFHITAVESNGEFRNLYDACFVKPSQPLNAGAVIHCKLTDMSDPGKVIAEGAHTVLVAGMITHTITIDKTITIGSNLVKNIHDVTIIIQDGFNP